MNENHKELISITLTVGIVIFALFIIHRFIPSLVWAAIISIATYPLYLRWQKIFGKEHSHNVSAALFTTFVGLIILLPLTWMLKLLITEMQLFINYLQNMNSVGEVAPSFLSKIPLFGKDLIDYWNGHIGQPGNVKSILSNLHLTLTPVSYYIKQVGISLAHRSFQLGFTLLILFFFYRDGQALLAQINHIGEYCLGNRWFRYSQKLPKALRGTVNGTILVGLGVGLLMGICYAAVGFPAPTLTGFITAIAAMIPFLVPLVFIIVALVLLGTGGLVGPIVVLVWGTVVMFVADHFVKPVMIGGAIQLPFLAVLFGILGGVENLGLLGLFVGPMVMVLFITLWEEPQG